MKDDLHKRFVTQTLYISLPRTCISSEVIFTTLYSFMNFNTTMQRKYRIKNSLVAMCTLSTENVAAYKFPCHLAPVSAPHFFKTQLFSRTLQTRME